MLARDKKLSHTSLSLIDREIKSPQIEVGLQKSRSETKLIDNVH